MVCKRVKLFMSYSSLIRKILEFDLKLIISSSSVIIPDLNCSLA